MTALGQLPSTVRAILNRGDRGGRVLKVHEREQVAALLSDTGIHGTNLAWMALLIRWRLGVGDYPAPPGSLTRQAHAYRLAEQRAMLIANIMLQARKEAA